MAMEHNTKEIDILQTFNNIMPECVNEMCKRTESTCKTESINLLSFIQKHYYSQVFKQYIYLPNLG